MAPFASMIVAPSLNATDLRCFLSTVVSFPIKIVNVSNPYIKEVVAEMTLGDMIWGKVKLAVLGGGGVASAFKTQGYEKQKKSGNHCVTYRLSHSVFRSLNAQQSKRLLSRYRVYECKSLKSRGGGRRLKIGSGGSFRR